MEEGSQSVPTRRPPSILQLLGAVSVAVLLLFPMVTFAMQSPFVITQPTRHGDLSAFTKWTGVIARYDNERNQCKGENCPQARIDALVKELNGKPMSEQIEAVNTFYNAVPYVEDMANYGMEDYWATPNQFLERGGDCEDYSIAKYMTLKRLGVPESMMKIIILQDNNLGGIMHAVLEVRLGDQKMLLDNQARDVVDESTIYHYRPIYALNGAAWWTYQ